MSVTFPMAFLGAPGPFEMLLVFAVALMLFGAKRLPEIARTIGSIVTEMRRASRDFQDQVMKEVDVEVDPPTTPPSEPTPPENISGGDQFPRGAPTEFDDDVLAETDVDDDADTPDTDQSA